MISEPTYLAARMVAPEIRAHFEGNNCLIPEGFVIEALIDTAFWASLRHEEGYTPKISLAYLKPEADNQHLIFGQAQRLTPHRLVKLSPAALEPGIHLGVWHDGDNLLIWGTTHLVPAYCLIIEVVEAGLLVVKQKTDYLSTKYTNLAVLKGNDIKVLDNAFAWLIPAFSNADNHILLDLSLAMRQHGRGALMLIVPAGSHAWQGSIVQPMNYLLDPPHPLTTGSEKAIHAVGGFSAIDGATIITSDYQLLAFGAKVARSDSGVPVSKIMLSEPVKNNEARIVDTSKLGGTRHLAAAQFVNDQHDAMAMVASQDGQFTLFLWSHELQIVHAQRIDYLLL